MVLFGQVVDGPRAAELGLAWACVPDEELQAEARKLAAGAAAAPRDLAERAKASLQAMATIEDHDAAVDRELEPQVWSINQPAFQERLAAMQARITSKA
jgi:enoyl-CoA hydratase